MDNGKIDVVITRYNEFINWVDYLPDSINKIYIYNKGFNNNLFKNHESKWSDKFVIIKTANVGRMEHTIAYHIVTNYNNLADTILFLPGSILMNPHKGRFLGKILNNIQNLQSKYNGFYAPMFKKVKNTYNYIINNKKVKDNTLRNNVQDINNSENEVIPVKSEYSSLLDYKEKIVNNFQLEYIAYKSQFMVSKSNILKNDIKVFEEILKSVFMGIDCENSLYAERIWAHLFK